MTLFQPEKYSVVVRLHLVAKEHRLLAMFCGEKDVDWRDLTYHDAMNDRTALKEVKDADVVVIGQHSYIVETEIMVAKLQRNCRVARIDYFDSEIRFY